MPLSEVASLPHWKSLHSPVLTFRHQTAFWEYWGRYQEEVSVGVLWRRMLASLFHKRSPKYQPRPSGQLLHIPAGKPASHLRPKTSPVWACLSFLPGPGQLPGSGAPECLTL